VFGALLTPSCCFGWCGEIEISYLSTFTTRAL
jgi:hypothetical protein